MVLQAIMAYHKMLKEVYGPQLVLEPYVLSIDAFQQYQQSGLSQHTPAHLPWDGLDCLL